MRVHELKIWPQYFQQQLDGTKHFEIRENDRCFAVGDYLALNEYSADGVYTGRALLVRVTSIVDDPALCKPGFVVMGTEDCKVIPKSGDLFRKQETAKEREEELLL